MLERLPKSLIFLARRHKLRYREAWARRADSFATGIRKRRIQLFTTATSAARATPSSPRQGSSWQRQCCSMSYDVTRRGRTCDTKRKKRLPGPAVRSSSSARGQLQNVAHATAAETVHRSAVAAKKSARTRVSVFWVHVEIYKNHSAYSNACRKEPLAES